MSEPTAVTGRIFDIQRFSIHDGPGIRTTVFMKGCTLKCVWCHNPEGISPKNHLSFLPRNCIGCGYCFRVCPNEGHRMDEALGHVLQRGGCTVCGACTEECWAKALEVVGREVTAREALDEVLKDRPFYETSNGGMTLSGGEPLAQLEFTEALLKAGKDKGLHNVIETCGHVDFSRIERVLPYVDLFLYDVKDTDDERHRTYTGAPLTRILENLRALHDRDAALLVRCPIVPGLNDRPDHFEALAALAKSLPNLQGVEILPYHKLGTSKRERIGIESEMELTVDSPAQETVAEWVHTLRGKGVQVVNEV